MKTNLSNGQPLNPLDQYLWGHLKCNVYFNWMFVLKRICDTNNPPYWQHSCSSKICCLSTAICVSTKWIIYCMQWLVLQTLGLFFFEGQIIGRTIPTAIILIFLTHTYFFIYARTRAHTQQQHNCNTLYIPVCEVQDIFLFTFVEHSVSHCQVIKIRSVLFMWLPPNKRLVQQYSCYLSCLILGFKTQQFVQCFGTATSVQTWYTIRMWRWHFCRRDCRKCCTTVYMLVWLKWNKTNWMYIQVQCRSYFWISHISVTNLCNVISPHLLMNAFVSSSPASLVSQLLYLQYLPHAYTGKKENILNPEQQILILKLYHLLPQPHSC